MELVSTKVQDRNLKPGLNSPRELVFMQAMKNVISDNDQLDTHLLYFTIRFL